MPDTTLSAAIKEAYASATAIVYHTLEFRHPAFTEPIRVVRDHNDLLATLEATAPENPGEEVRFVAFAFDFSKPEVSTTGVPQLTITIDNVSREIVGSIEQALTTTGRVRVTYREYIDSDLTEPQNDPPIHADIISITATVATVTAVVGFPNLTNRKFPTLAYTAEQFPGLIA